VKRGILALVMAASTRAAPAAAQTDASVGLGVGTVRYPGGSRFSSAAFSPGFHASTPRLAADLFGSVASLPGGIWSSQGRADLWTATLPLGDGVRLGAEGTLAGTRTDGGWAVAAHGLAEVLWSAPKWGFGLGAGPSAGWSPDTSVAALHTRARLWWRPAGGTDWLLSFEPTRFEGVWFTDATAGVTFERGSVILSVSASGRYSAVYGSKAAGSAFLQVFVSPAVSLELGGGSYLNDPYLGLPRAGLLTVGIRLHGSRRTQRGAPAPTWAPLVPTMRGDSLVVRFRMDSARSVAIAGDWNAWRPVPLRPADGEWEGTILLGRGLYHFNLLVDGVEWVVPNGVATVPDGLGGMVAVLVVP